MALNYQSVDFVKVLGERRSCRFYDPDRPVEAEKVQAICNAVWTDAIKKACKEFNESQGEI